MTARLRAQMERLRDSASTSVRRSKQELTAAEDALSEQKRNVAELEDALRSAERGRKDAEYEVARLQAQLRDLRDAKDALERDYENLQKEADGARQLREQERVLKERVEQLLRQHDDMEASIMREKMRADEASRRSTALQDKVDAMSRESSGAEMLRDDVARHAKLLDSERSFSRDLQQRLEAETSRADSLAEEKRKMAEEIEGAAAHLRLVALQKNAVTHELEQVYASLAEMESQLDVSRNENDRLRKATASISAATDLLAAPAHAPPEQSFHRRSPEKTAKVARGKVDEEREEAAEDASSSSKVHISRSGSISVTTGSARDEVPRARIKVTGSDAISLSPSAVPLPESAQQRSLADAYAGSGAAARRRARMESNTTPLAGKAVATPSSSSSSSRASSEHSGRRGRNRFAASSQRGSGGKEPSSVRRGTYWGTYSRNEASKLRKHQRTRSTFGMNDGQ